MPYCRLVLKTNHSCSENKPFLFWKQTILVLKTNHSSLDCNTGLVTQSLPQHRPGHTITAPTQAWSHNHCPNTGLVTQSQPQHRPGHTITAPTQAWSHNHGPNTGLVTQSRPQHRPGHTITAPYKAKLNTHTRQTSGRKYHEQKTISEFRTTHYDGHLRRTWEWS